MAEILGRWPNLNARRKSHARQKPPKNSANYSAWKNEGEQIAQELARWDDAWTNRRVSTVRQLICWLTDKFQHLHETDYPEKELRTGPRSKIEWTDWAWNKANELGVKYLPTSPTGQITVDEEMAFCDALKDAVFRQESELIPMDATDPETFGHIVGFFKMRAISYPAEVAAFIQAMKDGKLDNLDSEFARKLSVGSTSRWIKSAATRIATEGRRLDRLTQNIEQYLVGNPLAMQDVIIPALSEADAICIAYEIEFAARHAIAAPVSTPSSGHTIASILEETGLSNSTINKYAKLAGVRTPGPGKKNHPYTSQERTQILQTIVGKCTKQTVITKCKRLLGNQK
ncbi:MAG: hypothetical protein ABSF29_12535 [Tepidisphaeraceae bacterium]|jgi:hypothetical protein